jgi:MFS family permease
VLTPATLTWTLGSWAQARRVGRWTRRAMVTVGLAMTAAAIALAAAVLDRSVPVWTAALAWSVAGFGMGLSYSTTSLSALSEASDGRQGEATAAVQLTDVLGQALGTGLGGAIVALGVSGGWARRDALLIVFALMTAVALLGVVTARRFPADPAGLLPQPIRSGQAEQE